MTSQAEGKAGRFHREMSQADSWGAILTRQVPKLCQGAEIHLRMYQEGKSMTYLIEFFSVRLLYVGLMNTEAIWN